MTDRDVGRVLIAQLAVVLLVLGVSGCGKSADRKGITMASMSKEEEARCEVVQKYLLDRGRLSTPGSTALCVGGVMRDGAWPLRIVRIDETGKMTAAGSGTLDWKRWSLSVQALPQPEGGATVASILNFTLPWSEENKIRKVYGMKASSDCGTAVVGRALAIKGWLGKDEWFECIWFDKESQDDWIGYYLAYGQAYTVFTGRGRINLKDNSVEVDAGVID